MKAHVGVSRPDCNHALSTDASSVHRRCAYSARSSSPSSKGWVISEKCLKIFQKFTFEKIRSKGFETFDNYSLDSLSERLGIVRALRIETERSLFLTRSLSLTSALLSFFTCSRRGAGHRSSRSFENKDTCDSRELEGRNLSRLIYLLYRFEKNYKESM